MQGYRARCRDPVDQRIERGAARAGLCCGAATMSAPHADMRVSQEDVNEAVIAVILKLE